MSLRFPLRTARLDLRPFTVQDVPAAAAVYGDAEVMRHVGEGGAVGADEAAAMVAAYIAHQREHGLGFWAVVDRADGALIGDAGFELTEHGLELGYTLRRDRWGQGLATEAARACLEAASELRQREVVALVDAANPASAHVLEKLGFAEGGEGAADGESAGTVTSYGRPHRLFRLTLR
ncbi:GNAT family N-acetyltransferase [Brachybacterium sp. NBEC-018]|uniref:GNAT family N-acetyltransferase n=1 Tax=Brachybacterium sp. NBEC-018 TaxID=2996004 RepID=UPI002174E0EB|nr:GNAT family N-acetyltransferase [Brachybacterium sp. NBEC-018]UVY85007.1 GNAT family N-acetyltransferase [Brachybacterium sp. NBEC-018]